MIISGFDASNDRNESTRLFISFTLSSVDAAAYLPYRYFFETIRYGPKMVGSIKTLAIALATFYNLTCIFGYSLHNLGGRHNLLASGSLIKDRVANSLASRHGEMNSCRGCLGRAKSGSRCGKLYRPRLLLRIRTETTKLHQSVGESVRNMQDEEYPSRMAAAEASKYVSVEHLIRSNEQLRQQIQELEHENAQLHHVNKELQTQEQQPPRIILESFEGEGSLFVRDEFDADVDVENIPDTIEMEEVERGTGQNFAGQPENVNDAPSLTNSGSVDASVVSSITPSVESSEGDGYKVPWCDEINVEDGSCPLEPGVSFRDAVRDRALWLVGLLVMQSCSGFILARNEALLQDHPVIIYFLTMLVGAGGNAGNQASVRVIRGLALGSLNEDTQAQFLTREVKMAFALSSILTVAGFLRASFFRTPFPETIAVTTALCFIVFTSICLGAVLPLMLKKIGVDPAHSSTTIQVIMDILGVVMTVFVSSSILDTAMGRFLISRLSGE